MFRGGIPIGKVFGIHLRLHYSWFLVFGLITWALTAGYFPDAYPHWGTLKAVGAGILTSFLFFASLLAHELMHSLTAQSKGLGVESITLFVFGGVSRINAEPRRPGDEFLIAIAGPLTSLILGAVFWGLYYGVEGEYEFVEGVSFWLGWINVAIAGFNLIPGFPLDGGRVLRSILWWKSGNLKKSTKTASGIGRGVGYAFILGGIVIIFWGGLLNGLWLALIGWFLQNAAQGSYRQLAVEDMLQGHKVSEIMAPDCPAVAPDLPVDRLVHEYILPSGRRCFPVVESGRVIGLITMHEIKSVPRDRWPYETARGIMAPFDQLRVVHPADDLAEVLRIMTGEDVNQLPVVEEDGRMVGMIARDRLLGYISLRGELDEG